MEKKKKSYLYASEKELTKEREIVHSCSSVHKCLPVVRLLFICSISCAQSSMRQRVERLSLHFSLMFIILSVPQHLIHHDCIQTSKDLRSLFIYLLYSGFEMPFPIFKVCHYFLFQSNSSSPSIQPVLPSSHFLRYFNLFPFLSQLRTLLLLNFIVP